MLQTNSVSVYWNESKAPFFYLTLFLLQPPKLPLPNIDETMRRYLDAVKTFTAPDDFIATTKLVEEFLDDQEKKAAIMALLQKKDAEEDSWV